MNIEEREKIYIDKIQNTIKIQDEYARDIIHNACDDILLEFIREIGYGKISDEFDKMRDTIGFWYA